MKNNYKHEPICIEYECDAVGSHSADLGDIIRGSVATKSFYDPGAAVAFLNKCTVPLTTINQVMNWVEENELQQEIEIQKEKSEENI